MTNIDKIRQEIERRMEELERDKYINIDAKACRHSELKFLERFIDSMPEEKPSEELEEAAEEYVSKTLCDPNDGPSTGLAKGGFIAGAEWQKKHLKVVLTSEEIKMPYATKIQSEYKK